MCRRQGACSSADSRHNARHCLIFFPLPPPIKSTLFKSFGNCQQSKTHKFFIKMRNLTLLLNCRSGAVGGGVGWGGGGDVTRVTTVEKAELGLWPPGCPRGSGGGQRSEQLCPLCTPTSFTRAVLELRRPPVSGLLKAVGIGSGGKHLHLFMEIYGHLWKFPPCSSTSTAAKWSFGCWSHPAFS